MAFTVAFWGVRGSIPAPGPATARYGGNTPCVSAEHDSADGRKILVFDAGTGIRLLGNELVERANGELEIDLLLSHTHWDHIQGLPFFTPLFDRGNVARILGPKQGKVNLERILTEQMNQVVFPVPLKGLAAQLEVEHVTEGEFEVGGFDVEAMRLRHPANTLGYLIKPVGGGPKFAYLSDNELGTGGDYGVEPSWREDIVRFLTGADTLVHDSMYTPEQLERFRGWGHSSYQEAVALAAEAGVKQLVLFHHRPDHDDGSIDVIIDKAKTAAAKLDNRLDVIAAAEGQQLTL
jgi:phosphoribosyl 1,2-cyclic phosphodiesterase